MCERISPSGDNDHHHGGWVLGKLGPDNVPVGNMRCYPGCGCGEGGDDCDDEIGGLVGKLGKPPEAVSDSSLNWKPPQTGLDSALS